MYIHNLMIKPSGLAMEYLYLQLLYMIIKINFITKLMEPYSQSQD